MQSLALYVFYSQLLDFGTQTLSLIYIFWIHVRITAIVEVAVQVQNVTLTPEDVPNIAAYLLMTSNTSFDDFRQHLPLEYCHTLYLCWT